MEIGLIDAWKLWATGVSVADYELWGLQILWWGRIGKFVQLIAAITIIAEIIGAKNLREFGRSLHPAYPLAHIRQLTTNAKDWVKTFYGYIRLTKREVSREE